MKKNNKIKIKNLDIFLSFLLLGLTSFGGPIAHIGYFRDFFVNHKKWLDEKLYADFVSLNGEQGAKEAGKMRVEGKNYIVKDGDILHFLFNA